MTKNALLALLALGFIVLPVQGHASPTPLDNEIHILTDETSDGFAYYDGFDIQDIFIREAYVRDLDQTGVVLRAIIYGGFGAAPVANQMRLEFQLTSPGGEQQFTIATSDGLNWTGDATVLEVGMEPTETGIGTQGSVQVFVPYSQIGVAPEDNLSAFRVVSYADSDPRDVTPGGYYLPGTGQELPGDGAAMRDSYTISGPTGYTQTAVSREQARYRIDVTNLISVVGQHIAVETVASAGWDVTVEGEPAVAVEPGIHPRFILEANSAPDASPLVLAVTSELGGRELLTIAPSGELLANTTTTAPPPTPTGEPEKDAPSIPAVLLLGALLGLACVRRR